MDAHGPLGAAGLPDRQLAHLLGEPSVHDVTVRAIAHGAPAMTSGGVWRVSGLVRAEEPFTLVVKVVQSADRSPVMALVPEEMHAVVLETLPWHVEPAVYRSSLAAALPDGLLMAECLAVVDLDVDSAAIWLREVVHEETSWKPGRYEAAARMLGSLAASADVAAQADRVGHPVAPHQARAHHRGRISAQFATAYREGAVWSHPVVAAQVDAELRERLMALVDLAPELIEDVEALPLLSGHGDACPNNLLVTGEGFTAIDWGFFGRHRLGFDLSQLAAAEVELGRASAGEVIAREASVLAAYRDGLAQEGYDASADELRRAHVVQLALSHGISSIPLESLGLPPAVLAQLLTERLLLLRHLLEQLGL